MNEFRNPVIGSKLLLSSTSRFLMKWLDGRSEIPAWISVVDRVAFTNMIQNGMMLRNAMKVQTAYMIVRLMFNMKEPLLFRTLSIHDAPLCRRARRFPNPLLFPLEPRGIAVAKQVEQYRRQYRRNREQDHARRCSAVVQVAALERLCI